MNQLSKGLNRCCKCAGLVLAMLFAYRTATTWPGLLIVLSGVPVYLLLRRASSQANQVTAQSTSE